MGSQFQQSLDYPILFFCLFFIYFLFPRHIRLFPCTPAPAAIHVFSLVVCIFFLLLVVVEAVGRRMAEISIIFGMTLSVAVPNKVIRISLT